MVPEENKTEKTFSKFLKNKFLLVGFFVVVAGGVWAYFFVFPKNKENSLEKKIQIPELPASEVIHDSAGEGKEAHKPSEEQLYFLEPPFFRLPTFRIPIIRQGRLFAYFHLKVEMEANSHQSFNLAKFLLPRLVDKVFTDLYVAMSNLWSVGADPTSEAIKERIYKVCDQILGKGSIKGIYIPQIIIDRL
jgi:flagellar basal body-associated protein FliL